MRVLSLDEVKAVVGHELAHFSGADTIYSKNFAPIYRGLAGGGAGGGRAQAIRQEPPAPAGAPLLALHARLLRAQRRQVQPRARTARRPDRLRQASTPADLGYALIKTRHSLACSGTARWTTPSNDLSRGKFRRNMSASFEDKLRYDVDPEKLPPLVSFSLGDHTPHPTDTHPETKERLNALGLNLVDVTSEARVMERFFAARPATMALDNMEGAEEALTQIYHQSDHRPAQRAASPAHDG
jgi:hypothetical protein